MEILDVDLLAFETGSAEERRRSSMVCFTSPPASSTWNDLSSISSMRHAQLEAFFTLPQECKDTYVVPGSNGQSGYTGLLVETAAIADVPDWKEMLNWGAPLGDGHPLRQVSPPLRSADPSGDLPGVRDLAMHFHHSVADLQRRVLRIIAEGLGPTRPSSTRSPMAPPSPGNPLPGDGTGPGSNMSGRRTRRHQPHHGVARATAAGLQLKTPDGEWSDVAPPEGSAIINTGLMLER